MTKANRIAMERAIENLKRENAELRDLLGYKEKESQANDFKELAQENIVLKKELGYTDKEIKRSLRRNSPYYKSDMLWWFYFGCSFLIFISCLITFLLVK